MSNESGRLLSVEMGRYEKVPIGAGPIGIANQEGDTVSQKSMDVSEYFETKWVSYRFEQIKVPEESAQS